MPTVAAWAGEGLVSVQSAAASCQDDSGALYVDCGNGTVTDNRSGLVWLKDANCIGALTWSEALDMVAGLGDIPESSSAGFDDCGLSDGSVPGEWRVPSIAEWEAMMADAVDLGCFEDQFGGPAITDDAGTSCWQNGPGNSFTGIVDSFYWSASSRVSFPVDAWGARLNLGDIHSVTKGTGGFLWPVRGGQ